MTAMIDAVIFNAFLEFIDASLMFANPQSQARILDPPAASSRRAGRTFARRRSISMP
jgi:hypothetical protein